MAPDSQENAVAVIAKGARRDGWNSRIRVVYSDRDGGWYRVMRDEICVTDFRDPRCADSYARSLRKEARANSQPPAIGGP